jgi:hypothetical protein
MPIYKTIVSMLQTPPDFLQDIKPYILAKLDMAARDMEQEIGIPFAINQCLHLASSIILRHPRFLSETMDYVKSNPAFANLEDRTTVVAISILYDELNKLITGGELSDEAKKPLKRLHELFDRRNWMVEPEHLRILGMEPLQPN